MTRSTNVGAMLPTILKFVSALLLFVSSAGIAAPASLRSFTVADGIGVAVFGDPHTGKTEPSTSSPDRSLAVVVAERGRLDINRIEAEVRVYRLSDLQQRLEHGEAGVPIQPLWSFTEAPYKEGPAVQKIQWLDKSSGFVFLRRSARGLHQLVMADLASRSVRALTHEKLDVWNFAVKDAQTYVYSGLDVVARVEALRDVEPRPATSVGDRYLPALIFSPERYPEYELNTVQRHQIWAVYGGRHILATDPATKQALTTSNTFPVTISPDGAFALAAVLPSEIPTSWIGAFRDRVGAMIELKAGKHHEQDLSVRALARYVLIDVETGAAVPFQTVVGGNVGVWPSSGRPPAWSSDSGAVLLPGAYVLDGPKPADACVTVMRVRQRSATCAISLGSSDVVDGGSLRDVAFSDGRDDRISLKFAKAGGAESTGRDFVLLGNGMWTLAQEFATLGPTGAITLEVRQDLNERPVLWARDARSGKAMTLWDPNPQLDQVALGKVSVYRWTDESGRQWEGGLYLPPDHRPGQRHPLVIQTHGFARHDFRSAGTFPSAFAAQPLAASGIVVVQVADCPIRETEDEGPCQVRGYRALVERLADEGLIDRDKVGIVGFSRTCYYVLEALTDDKLRLAAAANADGLNAGYFQYLYSVNISMNAGARGFERMNGARPFGEGLKVWLEKSPLFRSDRIKAPLLETAFGEKGLMIMWEPLAVLRYQNKPVDLILLDTQEHVLTKPSARMASQGSTVDWFRFWLQGYEDTDPAKAEQYARWHKLREMRDRAEAARSPRPS